MLSLWLPSVGLICLNIEIKNGSYIGQDLGVFEYSNENAR